MLRYSIVLVFLLFNFSMGMEKWKEDMLQRENNHRSDHGSEPLEYTDELEKRAQKWADNLAQECAELTPASHMPREGNPEAQYKDGITGENLHAGKVGAVHTHTHIHISRYIRSAQFDSVKKMAYAMAAGAADAWYKEKKDYPWNSNYDGHPIGVKIGHFSQQVWADSKEVGYGLGLRDGCDKFYVVARYYPTGNIQGEEYYNKNVKPAE